MADLVNVVVYGSAGRMGQAIIRLVLDSTQARLTCALVRPGSGLADEPLDRVFGVLKRNVDFSTSLDPDVPCDVLVDFSGPNAFDAALALAPKFKDSPDYGWLFYRGNVARAINALRDGDRKTAVHYMLEATKAPSSERLSEETFMSLDYKLTDYLLDAGERDSVAQFQERSWMLREASFPAPRLQ